MDTASLSPILGIVIKFIISYLRNAPWFSGITEIDKGKVLAAAGVLSALAAVIAESFTGGLSDLSVTTLSDTILTAVGAFSTSVALHEATKHV